MKILKQIITLLLLVCVSALFGKTYSTSKGSYSGYCTDSLTAIDIVDTINVANAESLEIVVSLYTNSDFSIEDSAYINCRLKSGTYSENITAARGKIEYLTAVYHTPNNVVILIDGCADSLSGCGYSISWKTTDTTTLYAHTPSNWLFDADSDYWYLGRKINGNNEINNNTAPIVVHKTGRLGIGTKPTNQLDIAGNSRFSVNTTNPDAVKIGNFHYDNDALSIESNGSVQVVLDRNNNNEYKVFDVKSLQSGVKEPILRVFEDGRVGIYTTTPRERLHVNGVLAVDQAGYDFSNINIGHQSNDRIFSDNDGWYGGGLFFRVHNENNSINYVDAMMITEEGNVGIGIRQPSEKLVVNGIIKAKELIIEDPLTADFVFENDYNLRTLNQVEEFIAKNKHLPEVPSAKQMEENGVSVAQMNQILLQKVEELTLYMIQQEKRIQKLESVVK